jgi:CBS domain-containing protein
MATIGELFCDKHSQDALIGVIAVPPTATVIDATGVMNAHGIGAVLVMDGLHPVGIVAAGNSPEDTLLRDVMTRDLVFCSLDDEVDAVADIMRSKRIRHVPVLDAEGFVVGMVSIGDINAFRLASFEVALHQIESYVYSRN